MNIAVFSITENGRQLSLKAADVLSAEHRVSRYCFHKHTDDSSAVFWNMGSMVGRLFERSDAFIFVCACGIAVRAAAPYLGTKPDDPAIIVMDDGGRFVIPVISGRTGAANHLADLLSASLGVTAVITTSDEEDISFSIENFASANELVICDSRAAKEIASAVLHDEKIGFYSNYRHSGLPEELTEFGVCRTGICVDTDINVKPFDVTVNLVPRNIVIGIFCEDKTDSDTIENAVMKALDGIDIRRVRQIAVSGDTAGFNSLGVRLGVSVKSYSEQELEGTGSVCEKAAELCSGGKLIAHETVIDNIKIAVAEAPVFLDFERKS